ncbi:MAG: haloacid dehalogenase-like hydrolase, partial [Candidatus Latescibacterota bacterium]
EEDTLWVSVRQLIAEGPWRLVLLPFFVMGGRAGFKRRIANLVTLDPGRLTYREDILAFLREEKARGRVIVLATAADRRIADAVANHTGLFDGVMATQDGRNLKGPAKLAAILERTKHGPFDYMGDSKADYPIFRAADTAYLVHPTHPGLAEDVRRYCRVGKIFE